MKIYRIPEKCAALIFDIDSTLYTCPEYAHEQIDCQIRKFAEIRGITTEEARKIVADYRQNWAEKHHGERISLGNLLTAFGIPIATSIEWRKTLLNPADYLSYDQKLFKTISRLQKQYKIVCVTNNPVLPARKTLVALGISELIPDIIGLDTCFHSKPAKEPFEYAAKLLMEPLDTCISIGDRYDIDIALPLEMGMGGILVTDVSEVYKLPDLLQR
jgi:HAD superfamily hydrolase (TIGR01549 family)